jgi:hypothetical protein
MFKLLTGSFARTEPPSNGGKVSDAVYGCQALKSMWPVRQVKMRTPFTLTVFDVRNYHPAVFDILACGMDDSSLARTLGMIYDVAVAPDRWPVLLDRLAQDFECHFTSMNMSSANRDECRAMAVGVDCAGHQDFVRRFNRTNPIALRVGRGLTSKLIEASKLIARS